MTSSDGPAEGVQQAEDERFEVVISPDDGLDEEHADLLRKRLLADGFHDHAVSVRPKSDEWDDAIHAAEGDLFMTASIRWGGDAQMAKAAEEFSELAAECSRELNGQADRQEFLEELVDARVMIAQLTEHITVEALEEMAEEKLDQLADRLHTERSTEVDDDE